MGETLEDVLLELPDNGCSGQAQCKAWEVEAVWIPSTGGSAELQSEGWWKMCQ